ncbi:hypothetical protein [Mycobacterium sp.]|uniref:hypothetical protein n=1 Tax=Mycobacterium sp. TaxID=1785 RepID=UPI002DA21B61|nr:hypothetical protein [Mycobacterium sp.]
MSSVPHNHRPAGGWQPPPAGQGGGKCVGDPAPHENLLQSRLIRISDQTALKVFLQGLMYARSGFPLRAMGVLRDVLDLHAGHGAIWALMAPLCKYLGRDGRRHMPER